MTTTTGSRLSAWRFITAFGVISLLADLVYEGAPTVTGPYLATLGASATLVAGHRRRGGPRPGLAARSGPLANRTRAYWPLTLTGYAVTLATVPLPGAIPALAIACALVIAERGGKAIRSPAKDVLLSHAAAVVGRGRGRGFAVHKALDQIGAAAGPFSWRPFSPPPPAIGSAAPLHPGSGAVSEPSAARRPHAPPQPAAAT